MAKEPRKLSDPSLPLITLSSLAASDLGKIRVPAGDLRGATGAPAAFTLADLYKLIVYDRVTKTSHGLIADNVGSVLAQDHTILSHLSTTDYPIGILMEVIDANTIVVAPPNSLITLPVARLEHTNTYNINTHGKYVFWNVIAGIYHATRVISTASQIKDILEVISVGSTTFDARVRPF